MTTATALDDQIFEHSLRSEEEFSKLFKHKLTDPVKIGGGQLVWNPARDAFSLTTPNGSILSLRFYDTVKPIFDYQNVEVPGKESFLSYIEVVVRPHGIKGFMFKSDVTQAVWGDSKSKAAIKHEAAIAKLEAKAKSLGIDELIWRHNFDRTT